jgi:hypothetical protein
MGVCSSSNKPKKEARGQKISGLSDSFDKTIIECKITRDNIRSYIKRLEKNENLKKEKAKDALRKKDRDRAKMYLSQSKMYREQINSATGQLNLIEDQIMQIETAKQQKDALRVLEQGNTVLKKLYEEVNVEKFEKIADDMNRLKEQQEEIGNFLKSRGMDQAEYDESVEKELEKMMKVESQEMEVALPKPGEKQIIVLKQVEKIDSQDEHSGEMIEN